MPEEHRGYSSPDEINSPEDAVDFLGIGGEVTQDKIDSSFQDLSLELHPDAGGTTELFQALQEARDFAEEVKGIDFSEEGAGEGVGLGDIFEEGGPDPTPDDDIFTPDDFDDLKDAIRSTLTSNFTQEELYERFGPDADIENLTKVLASLVVNGAITLGDITRIVTGETRFGGSGVSGGDDRFQGGDLGGDSRFSRRGRGGGDDRFG